MSQCHTVIITANSWLPRQKNRCCLLLSTTAPYCFANAFLKRSTASSTSSLRVETAIRGLRHRYTRVCTQTLAGRSRLTLCRYRVSASCIQRPTKLAWHLCAKAEARTKPSPAGPNPEPGVVTTSHLSRISANTSLQSSHSIKAGKLLIASSIAPGDLETIILSPLQSLMSVQARLQAPGCSICFRA
jgi:hypothetical protein